MKRCFGCFVLLAALASPVQATFRLDTFEEPNWSLGDPLSAFKYDAQDSTTGIIEVVKLAGAPSRGPESAPVLPTGGGGTQALRLVYGGPGASTVARTQNNGMGNNVRVDGRVWGAVDIYKGGGDLGFIWGLEWTRGTNASLMGIDGFWDSVRLRQENVAGRTVPLNNGWNQVVVMNDATANPNTTMWLNGVLVDQIHGTGQAQNPAAKLQRAALTQKGRTEATFDGEIFFDNIYGGNEQPIFASQGAQAPAVSTFGMLLVALALGFFGAKRLSLRRRTTLGCG